MTDQASENDWKDDDFLQLLDEPQQQQQEENNDADDDQDDAVNDSDSATDNIYIYDPSSLPPWMDHPHGGHALTALHNEIVGFSRLMEATSEETERRVDLIARIKSLVANEFSNTVRVDVFGSQATGLFLPTSDIDLVLVQEETSVQLETTKSDTTASNSNSNTKSNRPNKSQQHDPDDPEEDWNAQQQQHEQSNTTASIMDRFERALREHWVSELCYLDKIENTRVPLVKFTMAATNLSVDVSFLPLQGVLAAKLVRSYLDALPALRPLTLCIKSFMAARDLHVPYTGGVGSYMLQLMIVAVLQHSERHAHNYKKAMLPCCLGSLLLEFLELYGCDLNYHTTGISVRNDGFFFPKGAASKRKVFVDVDRLFLLALENPLEPTMDVGRSSFRMQLVQRSFVIAHKVLLGNLAEPLPAVPVPSILATILEPTQEMYQRKLYKQQLLDYDNTTEPLAEMPLSGYKSNKRQRNR
jgi:non-canonical poly(A) RNA polymerase PAPD5/7